MKTLIAFLSLPLACLVVLTAQPAAAKDEPLDFLHALQEKGFADVAIEYLKGLKEDRDAPKEIIDIWDLEMSRSYRAAAKDAYGESGRKYDEEQQKLYLDKFIKENPNRPEALQAAAEAADERAKKAVLELAQANATTDAKTKAALLEDVRKTLAEVKPLFVKAVESLGKRLAALPANASSRMRENMRLTIVENRLNAIIVDFYMAMSYPDSSSEHSAMLTKASQAFDDLYQETRGTLMGLNAHYWQGRVLQDLKNYKDAFDVFEEVLAADSDVPDSTSVNPQADAVRARQKTGLEEFFADTENHYLQCMLHAAPKEYFAEAVKWRKSHKPTSEKTGSYQALSLDLAKAYVKLGEKTPAKKADYVKFALEILSDMIKVESPSRLEAIRLKKQLRPGGSDAEDSYDELIANGNAAIKDKEWAKAAADFAKALDHPPPKMGKKDLDEVHSVIAECLFRQAHEVYAKSKGDEAKEILTGLLKKYLDAPIASAAAKFKLDILVYEYSLAPENTAAEKQAKAALETKVVATANGVIVTWPGKPEADAARLILMKILLVHGKLKEAADFVQKMNVKSEFFGSAQHLMGASYWHSYMEGKLQVKALEDAHKPAPADLKAKRDDDRKRAMDTMHGAVEVLAAQRGAPDARMSPALVNAQLALAQMCGEGGDWKAAVLLYRDLVADIQRSEKPSIDDNTLRIFKGAVNAYLQINEIDNAAGVSSMLLKLGPDERGVNMVLIAFAMQLEVERKGLQRKLDASPAPPESQATEFRNKRDSYAKLLEELLKSLAGREKLEPKNLVWIASTAGSLGLDNLAAESAKKIIDRCENDEVFAKQVDKAIPLLRTLLVDIQARKGNYEEAIAQVDELIKKFPRALKPLQTKGEILEKWAKKEPTKFDEAIVHWEKVRRWLQRVPADKNGNKMAEFYEVTYREAKCLYEVAQRSSNKEKAVQGLQLLQQVLMFDPKMTDPKKHSYELYDRYKKLATALAELAGVDLTKKSASSERPAE